MLNLTQLENFLRHKFGAVKKSKGKYGLELITRCPVCGKKKLSVNANTGLYQCWHGCDSGHIDTLLGNVKIAKVNNALAVQTKTSKGFDPPGELIPLTQLDEDHHAITYLVRRGFNPTLLDQYYGIRYCAQGKPYMMNGIFNTTNTIIIPVYQLGELIGWQSRLLYDPAKVEEADCEAMGFVRDEDGDWVRPPKYFTMPGLDKGQVLWNYDWARQSKLVVICEGVFDAIAVGRCAVATFGKGVTEKQRLTLSQYWDLIVCLLDPDAEEENIKLRRELQGGTTPAITVTLKGYKDAGEAPQLEIWKQIDEAARTNNPPFDLSKVPFIV